MKLKEKIKYKIVQNLYGKNFNKKANKLIDSVDEIDDFIGGVLDKNTSKENKYKYKKRRRI